MVEFLLERMSEFADRLAIGTSQGESSYRDLMSRIEFWQSCLQASDVTPGSVVSLEGEYGLDSISAFLALTGNCNVIVPLSSQPSAQHERCLEVAQVQWRIVLADETPCVTATGLTADHSFYEQLRSLAAPGLVLFTSGSTGEAKAAVHNLGELLQKFTVLRSSMRSIVFLHLDHIGGINTLLFTVSNGGAIIVPAERTPTAVCEAIERYQAELLPTSPTFLNLLILSEAYKRYDLSSLKRITYGTEPMPESTLQRVAAAFPQATLQQTYGMTELGILRSQSQDSRSLWVRVGGEGFETKVVDGRLWVRAKSAMLGYMNAPSPFDEEGFLDTGDRVEVDGEWLRILGRQSEMINVGGQKVFPAEVESVLLRMPGVEEVSARGEPHPITGQIVSATVRLKNDESLRDFKTRMRVFCRDQLPAFAIPSKVQITQEKLHSERFKTTHR